MDSRTVRVDRVGELREHRVVVLGLPGGAKAQPDVIRRVRRRAEGEVEIIGGRRERRVGVRPSSVRARQQSAARRGRIADDRPATVQVRGVRRIQHDVAGRGNKLGRHQQHRNPHTDREHSCSHRELPWTRQSGGSSAPEQIRRRLRTRLKHAEFSSSPIRPAIGTTSAHGGRKTYAPCTRREMETLSSRELFRARPYGRRLCGTVTALSIGRGALTAGRRRLAPGPTGEADSPERDGTALRPSPAGGGGRCGSQQLAVGLGRFAGRRRRRRRPLSRRIFNLRNPARDVRERFRAADRASQLIVDFLTVHTEAGDTKLHPFMIAGSASIESDEPWLRQRTPRHGRLLIGVSLPTPHETVMLVV